MEIILEMRIDRIKILFFGHNYHKIQIFGTLLCSRVKTEHTQINDR